MQKVPGERYVYKFLPDTMQASNPFTAGQIPYPGQISDSKTPEVKLETNFTLVPWAFGANPSVSNPSMHPGFPQPTYQDFYCEY